ncbi:MAG: FHA domain-containing protein, partial [Scardovia wiggsiae]
MADNSAGPAEWDIRVGNKNVARVRPGQSLVIGRKPIRPLPEEEGRTRLDIIDDTKSVSKRHALFTADEAGNATVEDLDSTNGTYVVTANDDLWRIVADIPFDLPAETVHLQLGDVPVDAVPVVAYEEPEPVSQPMAAVSSLFSYASSVRQDDAHGGVRMSVDDILDVRQGEPTQMFHAMKQDFSPFSRIHDTAVNGGRARNAGVSTDGEHGME